MALWLQIRGKELQFCFKKRHDFWRDRATIGPRSRRDRATIAPRSGPNLCRGRSSGHLDAIPPLKECNRRSIATFFQKPSVPLD